MFLACIVVFIVSIQVGFYVDRNWVPEGAASKIAWESWYLVNFGVALLPLFFGLLLTDYIVDDAGVLQNYPELAFLPGYSWFSGTVLQDIWPKYLTCQFLALLPALLMLSVSYFLLRRNRIQKPLPKAAFLAALCFLTISAMCIAGAAALHWGWDYQSSIKD